MKYVRTAREHLEKARDSALLAVEFYNKPAVRFKAAGYITMMMIAWTALFHAIFFKRKIKPFYKLENGRFDRREGDYRYWELATCIKEYFKNENNAIRANLLFFIPLRNKIEHRSMPKLDSAIFGECQSMLLNFDSIVEDEFGAEATLKESLSFSLQIFPKTHSINFDNPSMDERDVVNYIKGYRSSLSGEVYANSRFAFKAFLIRIGNHNTKDSVPIKFVDYDSLDEEQQQELLKLVAFVKTKECPVLNPDLLRPGEVVLRVQEGIGNLKVKRYSGVAHGKFKLIDRFNAGTHTLFWKKYKVRPASGAKNPGTTRKEFCVYDKLNRNYGYTEKWVDFLIKKTLDDDEYLSLFSDPGLVELVNVEE